MSSDEGSKKEGAAKGYSFIDQISLNYKGMMGLENLYKMMYDWLTYRGYVSATNPPKDVKGADANFEDYYYELTLPGGTAKNQVIWWRTRKVYDESFWYEIDIQFVTFVVTTKEEVFKGTKVKVNDGEIVLNINARLVVDPDNNWTKDWVSELMFNYLKQDFYWKLIENREDELFDHVYGLYDRIKQNLGLITSGKPETPFIPTDGMPTIT